MGKDVLYLYYHINPIFNASITLFSFAFAFRFDPATEPSD